MVTKVGMYSATYESVTMPVGRDRKIRTALRSNQIIGFVTVPSEKKIIDICMHAGSSEFASLFSLAHFLHTKPTIPHLLRQKTNAQNVNLKTLYGDQRTLST